MNELYTLYQDKYIWHNEKNAANQKKHGISFEEAVGVFDDPFMREKYDFKNSIDETRFNITGTVTGIIQGKLVTVSVTYRDEFTRIFSARFANYTETKDYYNAFKKIVG